MIRFGTLRTSPSELSSASEHNYEVAYTLGVVRKSHVVHHQLKKPADTKPTLNYAAPPIHFLFNTTVRSNSRLRREEQSVSNPRA